MAAEKHAAEARDLLLSLIASGDERHPTEEQLGALTEMQVSIDVPVLSGLIASSRNHLQGQLWLADHGVQAGLDPQEVTDALVDELRRSPSLPLERYDLLEIAGSVSELANDTRLVPDAWPDSPGA